MEIPVFTEVPVGDGFEPKGVPSNAGEVTTGGAEIVVVDAALDRALLMDLPGCAGDAEVVVWWRQDSEPSLSTDDILRLRYRMVFDLDEIRPPAVPAGTRVPIELRADTAPSAEYVTLLGTPSARSTLRAVTRAVAAMHRDTPRPLWHSQGEPKELTRMPQVDDLTAWTRVGGELKNDHLPSLATLLQMPATNEPKKYEKNRQTLAIVAEELRRVGQQEYRIPPAALILGETGTGKTVMARRLHEALYPEDHEVRPFVEISAPTIRGTEFPTEFFGHATGAWTGMSHSIGPALEATFGTLFIDEIGDLDARSQQSLLTFLVNRTARLQGTDVELFLPLHIVAATNRPLEHMVAAGTFRQDLYNRFPFVIELQPLRDRMAPGTGDAERLIREVLSDVEVNPRVERGPRKGEPTVDAAHEDAVARLEREEYRTGNFRELIDILRRGVAAAGESGSSVLLADHLYFAPAVVEASTGDPIPIEVSFDELLGRTGFSGKDVTTPQLRRLAAALQVPLLVTSDDRLVVLQGGHLWAAPLHL